MSFAAAVAAAIKSVRSVAGGEIAYTRGANSVALDAAYGRSQFEATGENSTTLVSTNDFILLATDLVISSVQIEPRRNDFITATIGGTEKRFQVLEVNGVCFQRDQTGAMLRVHTKEIAN